MDLFQKNVLKKSFQDNISIYLLLWNIIHEVFSENKANIDELEIAINWRRGG